jgi:hypothetical protein
MFWMKIHRTDEGRLVAACDEDVLGQRFTEDGQQLDVDEDFYRGEKVELLDVLEAIEDAATTNFVGPDLIGELVDSDIIEEDEVDEIGGMVHTHMYFI